MRWYKTASMNITVSDGPSQKFATSTSELANAIDPYLWAILKKTLSSEQAEQFGKTPPYELLTIDGLDVDATEGILNLYVKGLPIEIIQKLLPAISYYAKEHGGEIINPRLETYGEKIQNLQAEKDRRGEPTTIFPENMPITEAEKMKDRVRVVRFKAKIIPHKEDIPLLLAQGG